MREATFSVPLHTLSFTNMRASLCDVHGFLTDSSHRSQTPISKMFSDNCSIVLRHQWSPQGGLQGEGGDGTDGAVPPSRIFIRPIGIHAEDHHHQG